MAKKLNAKQAKIINVLARLKVARDALIRIKEGARDPVGVALTALDEIERLRDTL